MLALSRWIHAMEHPRRVRIAVTVGIVVTTGLTAVAVVWPAAVVAGHASVLSGMLTNLVWLWKE